jgi:hypothetical protein
VRHRLLALLLSAGLLAAVGGCAQVRDRVDDVRASTDDLTDRARFCLSVARAVTAVESGAERSAVDAAEEALTHAPDEVAADARLVAESLRQGVDVTDPQLQDAAQRLEERTRELCAAG